MGVGSRDTPTTTATIPVADAPTAFTLARRLLNESYGTQIEDALGNFLAFDDAPWALLMATGVIYALPPTAIYYAFRRYMVSGLTAGAVKS